MLEYCPGNTNRFRLLVWSRSEGLTRETLHLPRMQRQASVDDETLV